MSQVWDERADAYRLSKTHAEGPDLDLVVDWCAPGPGPKVLGPIRNFLRSQPLVVGLVVGVVIMAAMLIAIFQLVPPDY